MSMLSGLLREARPGTGDSPVLIWRDRAWSFLVVDRLAEQLACGLTSAGVEPGGRVAVQMTNRLELVLSYFACFKLGAIAVPVNTRFRSEELDYVLRHSGATTYLGEQALYHELSIAPQAVRQRFVVDSANDDVARFDALFLKRDERSALPDRIDPDQPAAILYTSGTTDHPRGVVHTQRTLASAARLGSGTLLDAGDVVGIPSAMVHAAGLLAMLTAVRCGATTVLLANDPAAILEAVQRHRITAMLGLPAMYWGLIDSHVARPGSLASLRSPIVYGDVTPRLLERRFFAEWGRDLRPHYGMTEAFPLTYSRSCAAEDGSLGRAIPGVDLEVTDADGQPLSTGHVGELSVRSASVMRGYWDDPAATGDVLRGGWLRTGDLAYRDASGAFWFGGRKKDIIVRGGSNIAPAEVERILRQHPAVKDAVVVGLPDPALGEIVGAGIVISGGSAITEAEVARFARAHLADYKVPQAVVVMAQLPRTAAGKVERREARARIMRGRRDAPQEGVTPAI